MDQTSQKCSFLILRHNSGTVPSCILSTGIENSELKFKKRCAHNHALSNTPALFGAPLNHLYHEAPSRTFKSLEQHVKNVNK